MAIRALEKIEMLDNKYEKISTDLKSIYYELQELSRDVNEYKNDEISIYHFDLYRLGDIYEFENIGGEEYFSKGICIFEWGELIEDILPNDYIKISFEKNDNNPEERILNIETFGEKYNNIDFNSFVSDK